jgi:hypothetical protein
MVVVAVVGPLLCTPVPMDRDVSRGSSGALEERMVWCEKAERGGGARDVKGGE